MDTARAEQLTAMDATALVAELRALTAAGSSYDEQALCCVHLYNVLSLLPVVGVAAEDTVCAVVAALSCDVQHPTLQLAGCVALGTLIRAAPAASVAAGSAGVTAVLAALREHPGDANLQSVAFVTLSELVASDATNRATAGAAGGIATVVAATMTRQ
jgi:hypothetical protein